MLIADFTVPTQGSFEVDPFANSKFILLIVDDHLNPATDYHFIRLQMPPSWGGSKNGYARRLSVSMPQIALASIS